MTTAPTDTRQRGSAPQGAAASPTSGSGWKTALKSAKAHMKQDRVNVGAGAFAYRWFLSLFPCIIALLAVASLLAIPRHVTTSLVSGITKALPAGASGVLSGALTAASHRTSGALTAVIVAGLIALWSATSGMVMVEEALDMAYEINARRTFLQKRLLAVPLLIGAAVLGGAASALVVFGAQIGRTFKSSIPVGGVAFAAGWTVVRWVLALALISMLFSFLYWLAPNQRVRWRWVTPGALIGTALWAIISLGFSFYTSSFGSYAKTYGAFAGVAILIFWLFLTGLAILIGGEVNAAFERQEHISAQGTAEASSGQQVAA